jgi:hypothetical protein
MSLYKKPFTKIAINLKIQKTHKLEEFNMVVRCSERVEQKDKVKEQERIDRIKLHYKYF